ncbi:hypothetical protein [Rubellicoccus peritrichatus]|uniref:Uncharacterized protein n=1 Tax=Rubellicoccus peritrichatus TaxID=3080537 RepID=A0AAQ3QVG2_9BACT|nr:hypothetical protein [Puniceicoccus sp. CR14]WOO43396.1 hypothetical protein RZN69_09875 [Puniceicoccus sp. CR14]
MKSKLSLPKTLFVISFSLAFMCLANLHAQANSTDLTKVNISLLIEKRVKPVAYGEDGDNNRAAYQEKDANLYYWSNDKYNSISIKPNTPSKPFEYSGPPRLVLFEKLNTVGANGENQYRPLMEANLAPGITDYLLVGTKQSSKSSLQKLIALPIDSAKLPEGSILAINLSSKPLTVAYESGRVTLNPLKPALIDVSKAKEFKFRILAAIQDGGEHQMVYRRIWSVKPTTRGVCLFFPINEKMTRWNTDLIKFTQ